MAEVTDSPPRAQPAAPPDRGGGPGADVLVVEDERTLREIVRRNLEARHYRVRAATTAAEALAAIRAERPAVLLLDINLPDGSGWDVLRELHTQGQHVPTIVVSAVRCSRARLEEFRPEAYLPKPFPLGALLGAVERLTGAAVPPGQEE
jgi:DNA-binding response OmpR family regulator